MAKRGRKKGSTNQVAAHVFDADSMMHLYSFIGTTEIGVREQIDKYLRVVGLYDKSYLILWGLGEVVTFTASTEKASVQSYTDEFFYNEGAG